MSALAAEELRLPGPRVVRATLRSPTRAILSPEILRLDLVADEELDTGVLAREFPTLEISCVEECRAGDVVVDDFAWRGAFDCSRFDDALEQARPARTITVRGDDSAGVACEVLGRYQRFVARRNEASSDRVFDDVLTAHARVYDPSSPLSKLDFDHGLDTMQWMPRLDPRVGLAAQIAALFHDLERLDKDPQEKMEHRAPEHRSGARGDGAASLHARRRLATLLEEARLAEDDVAHVEAVLGGAEQCAREVALLDEADALSFLSLESSRYADHFGLAQTRRKVTHTLGRLGPRARDMLALVRLRPDIERLLHA